MALGDIVNKGGNRGRGNFGVPYFLSLRSFEQYDNKIDYGFPRLR